jgi:Fe-S-cluster containining protein
LNSEELIKEDGIAMEVCEKNNCVQCCMDGEVPLLNEDVSRITMAGYYDAYFVFEEDGVKTIRKFSDGCCIFYKKETGRCEIYKLRPEMCRLRPYTISEGSHEPVIDQECKHCSECKSDSKMESRMTKFFSTFEKEIEWRRKTGYF